MKKAELIARKLHYSLKETFRKKERAITDIYSPFGIPGTYLQNTDKRIKVIIDPPNHYFFTKLNSDRKNYDKLLLIHGCEPPEISDITASVLKHGSKFNKIYSFSNEVVSTLKNAEHFCFGSCWVATNKKGDLTALKKDYHLPDYSNKKFKVSFIKSNKQALPGHKLRYDAHDIICKQRSYELYFPKERIDTKLPLFNDAMFHIAMENSRHANYFTEKLIDCFMTFTIPIYWGCPNVADYFDKEGMIIFQTKEELDQILNSLSEEDFHKRKAAMRNNYEIALNKYAFFFDRLNEYICML